MRQEQLYRKLSKLDFWLESISFLGHIVSKEGIFVDPMKVDIVQKLPIPKTAIEIRNPIGMEGYYMRFIQDFTKIEMLMTKLIQKGKRAEWTLESKDAFEELKSKLTLVLILAISDKPGDIAIYTNAFGRGLECA